MASVIQHHKAISAHQSQLLAAVVELDRRKAALKARPRAREVGWLSVYQRLVRPLPEGAVLRPRGTAP